MWSRGSFSSQKANVWCRVYPTTMSYIIYIQRHPDSYHFGSTEYYFIFFLNGKIKQQRLVVKAMLFNPNAAETSCWHCYIKYVYCEHNVNNFFKSTKKPIRAHMDPSEVVCGEIRGLGTLRKRSVMWSNPTCTLVFFSHRLRILFRSLKLFIWISGKNSYMEIQKFE